MRKQRPFFNKNNNYNSKSSEICSSAGICKQKQICGENPELVPPARGAASLQSRLGGVGTGPGSLASGPQLRAFHTRRGLRSSAGPLPGHRVLSGRGDGPSVCSVCHNHVGGLRLGGVGAPLQSMLGAGEGALAGGRLGGQAVGRHRSGNLLVALAALVF